MERAEWVREACWRRKPWTGFGGLGEDPGVYGVRGSPLSFMEKHWTPALSEYVCRGGEQGDRGLLSGQGGHHRGRVGQWL